jgi:hypothetical protein
VRDIDDEEMADLAIGRILDELDVKRTQQEVSHGIASGALAGEGAAPVEPAHINADDLLGLLCHAALHCGVPTLCSELAALTARHAAHVDGVKAGITSTKVLEHAYGEWAALPEKDRKAFGETLQVWREKPDEAPELLRPHFAAGAAGAGAGGGKTPPKAPPANRGAGAPPPPGSRVAVKDLPDEGRKKLRGAFFGG